MIRRTTGRLPGATPPDASSGSSPEGYNAQKGPAHCSNACRPQERHILESLARAEPESLARRGACMQHDYYCARPVAHRCRKNARQKRRRGGVDVDAGPRSSSSSTTASMRTAQAYGSLQIMRILSGRPDPISARSDEFVREGDYAAVRAIETRRRAGRDRRDPAGSSSVALSRRG